MTASRIDQMSTSYPHARPGFTSFKVREPIVYPNRWQRDALVQATLDPAVTEIAPLAPGDGPLPPPVQFAFLARIAGMDFLVVIADRDPHPSTLPEPALPLLRITRRSLGAEPLASTAISIWSHKRLVPDPADRMRIGEALDGIPEGRPVAEIRQLLHNNFMDPVRQIFSMLANGFLVGDLNGGFHPRTVLRLGPAAIGDPATRPRDRLLSPSSLIPSRPTPLPEAAAHCD